VSISVVMNRKVSVISEEVGKGAETTAPRQRIMTRNNRAKARLEEIGEVLLTEKRKIANLLPNTTALLVV